MITIELQVGEIIIYIKYTIIYIKYTFTLQMVILKHMTFHQTWKLFLLIQISLFLWNFVSIQKSLNYWLLIIISDKVRHANNVTKKLKKTGNT